MQNEHDIRNLTGKILLSTMYTSDNYLEKTLVYIFEHTINGALGIAINKPLPNINFSTLIPQIDSKLYNSKNLNLYFGGPSEINKNFILYSDETSEQNDLNNIVVSKNIDIIKVLVSKQFTEKQTLICIGCFQWESEQLEVEIASNYWIPVDTDHALIFGYPCAEKWKKAFLKIGSQTALLSSACGYS